MRSCRSRRPSRALTVFDMVKAVDKSAVITDIRVERKSGGKSGDWSRS